jgi:hypothetical protein
MTGWKFKSFAQPRYFFAPDSCGPAVKGEACGQFAHSP